METRATSDLECAICFNLLTESPEKEVPGPSCPKRSRPSDIYIPQLPQPSTSSAAFSSLPQKPSQALIPELCTTPCGHIFHKSCILNWVNIKKECPTCRKKVIPAFQNENETCKLTRVFLPLAPNQCQNCYEHLKELVSLQLKYTLQESLVESCKQKEEDLECTCNALIQKTEKLGGALNMETGKVKNLQGQMKMSEEKNLQLERLLNLEKKCVEALQDQLEGKEVEKVMEKHYLIQDFENDLYQLQQELRLKEQKILELEKNDKVLRDRCDQLEKEKNDLEDKTTESSK